MDQSNLSAGSEQLDSDDCPFFIREGNYISAYSNAIDQFRRFANKHPETLSSL